jgi:DNA-binding MarR family transcriptional regulator
MGVYEGLSELELQVLHAVPHAKSMEDLAKLVKASPATLGRTVARLQLEGYVADNGALTEKGREVTRKGAV